MWVEVLLSDALMDEQAQIYERGSTPTPQDTLEHFIETIGQLYDDYKGGIEGIALSMPGIIDPQKGYCFTGGALSYIRDIPMKERKITATLSMPYNYW